MGKMDGIGVLDFRVIPDRLFPLFPHFFTHRIIYAVFAEGTTPHRLPVCTGTAFVRDSFFLLPREPNCTVVTMYTLYTSVQYLALYIHTMYNGESVRLFQRKLEANVSLSPWGNPGGCPHQPSLPYRRLAVPAAHRGRLDRQDTTNRSLTAYAPHKPS